MFDYRDNYNEIRLSVVNQAGNYFFSGIVNVNYIKDIFTTSPAEYKLTSIKGYNYNEVGSMSDLIKKLHQSREFGYQRDRENDAKIDSIASYITSAEEYHIIPNSIIFALEAITVTDNDEIQMQYKNNPYALLLLRNDKADSLLIPQKLPEPLSDQPYKPLWIVDGHHRMQGIKKYLESNEDEVYDIVATFIINRDRVDEAGIFKTVNYEIKPVNKSFYYQISGEFEIGQKEFIYLHYLTRLFNEAQNSPLFGRFKMLGRRTPGSKVKQTISQSFFVEQLYYCTLIRKRVTKRHIFTENEKGNKELKLSRIPVLRFYFASLERDVIARILAKYYTAIQGLYETKYGKNKWFENDNVLLKQMCIGAFIEIFSYVYLKVLFSHEKQNPLDSQPIFQNLAKCEISVADFQKILKPIFEGEIDIVQEINSYLTGTSASSLKGLAILLWNKVMAKDESDFLDYAIEYANWYHESVYTNK